MEPLVIKIKYFDEAVPRIKKIEKGDWIDLYARTDVTINEGEWKLIPLGVGMKLPHGYEAIIAPRSSTLKTFKIICGNSFGIIDNSYSGNDDEWHFSALAMENTTIHAGDRICQFRIQESQPPFEIEEVKELDDENRGGFGSTGHGSLETL